MKRIEVIKTVEKAGEEVLLKGWIHTLRDKSKIIFFELRDVTGLVQCTVWHEDVTAFEIAKNLKPEDVIELVGKVSQRPENQVKDTPTGSVEIQVTQIKVLNARQNDLPFEINKDEFKGETKDDLRMEYRYLDLRRPAMKDKIILRSQVSKFIRDYFYAQGFNEIETPLLTKGTPEGAREFVIPSRLHQGSFYVLPQSPQQFKQMLMVAGLEKYFQIARCFRDEDQRGDRQPEFTQIDLEMSFIDQEDIMNLIEKLLIELVDHLNQAQGKNFKIKSNPFEKLTYTEAMSKYHCDKPDLREDKKNPNELAFCWVTDFPLFEKSESEGKFVSVHHPFTAPENDVDLDTKKPNEINSKAYDIVLNGYEIGGGSIRIHSSEIQHKVFEILGIGEAEIESRFGHILRAFEFGVPPHGGLALGFDRLIMLLTGDDSIREVIPFPKTVDAKDLMMGAPSTIDPKSLDEFNLKLK
ncbi:MAG: amino acid--tRNA ligase-related protein [Patescibacteria group bacterium]